MKKRKLNNITNNVTNKDIDESLSNRLRKIKIINKPLKEDKSTQTDFDIDLYIKNELTKYKTEINDIYKSYLIDTNKIKVFDNIYI